MPDELNPKVRLVHDIMTAIDEAKKAGVESPEKIILEIFKTKVDLEKLKTNEKLKRLLK